MPASAESSVGLVKTHVAEIRLPKEGFVLENGAALPELHIAYETYGQLAPDGGNVVLICHALSGDAHVAGYHSTKEEKPGWWDQMVGPGKGIDTNRYLVICSNILGGCKGTTGPSSINPKTGRPYGSSFPAITICDMVRAQRLLLDHLGIRCLFAVIGGSMGGMQVLEWSIRYPEMVERCICIASAASLSAQALAFDIVGRQAILSDPLWNGGDYYAAGTAPVAGLSQARMIGHITYLSPEMMDRKFGREKQNAVASPERFQTLFQIESYLRHQGEKFVERFDANSYLHITEAMDNYDLAERHGSLPRAFEHIRARYLVIALSSDWLFPPEQSLEIAGALLQAGRHVSYCMLHAPHGHDAFLVDIARLSEVVRAFLAAPATPQPPASTEMPDNAEQIQDMIRPGARVLDLGCGNGALLARLAARRDARGLGVDIDLDNIIGVMSRGLPVFQADIDEGLAIIPDNAYDYVLLSETLQVVRKPRLVLSEMLRVAAEGIVSFPNFAYWRHRLTLGLRGRMPKSEPLPFEWYDTPNIHLATLNDFLTLCRREGIRVMEVKPAANDLLGRLLTALGRPNLGAGRALVRIARSSTSNLATHQTGAPQPCTNG